MRFFLIFLQANVGSTVVTLLTYCDNKQQQELHHVLPLRMNCATKLSKNCWLTHFNFPVDSRAWLQNICKAVFCGNATKPTCY